MGSVNVTRLGPEATNDNAKPGARYEYVDRGLEYRASPTPLPDFRVVAVLLAGAVLFFVALALVYFIAWRLPVCWGEYYGACATARRIEPYAFGAAFALPFVVVMVYGALWAAERRARIAVVRAEASRTAIVLDRWGMPVSTRLIHGAMTVEHWQAFVESAERTKVLTAPHEFLPAGLDAYSPSNTQHAGDVVDGEVVENAIGLTPDSDWLRWVDRAPHLLLAGKTEAGKSTMASALLAERIMAGDEIMIFDPHYQPGKWFGIEAVAGIPDILGTLPTVVDELDARYEEFKSGKQTAEFTRLTILIDEVPAIVDQCIELTPSGRPKITDERWRRFAKRLGSEARKVRISVILLSQSTLVQDLMINVQMKENFTRIGLGDQARPLLGEEPLPKRRQALLDLLRGQAHPAAMEYRGDYYLLDTAGVPALAERSVGAFVHTWDIEHAAKPDNTKLLADLYDRVPAMHSAMNGHTQNGHKTADPHSAYHSAMPAMDDIDAEEIAIEYFAAGLSQREVGRLMRERGLTIDQNEFPRLQREGLKRRKG